MVCVMPVVLKVICVVAMALEVTLTFNGEKLQEAPTGRPLQKKVTVSLKTLTGATLRVVVVEVPMGMVMALVGALKAKVGAAPAVGALAMEAKRPCASPVRPAVK